jgi:hypothetical protein
MPEASGPAGLGRAGVNGSLPLARTRCGQPDHLAHEH